MHKALALGAALIASAVAFQPQQAEARGGALVAGAVIGLAAGAIIAGAARPAYAAPVYYGYRPVSYVRHCWTERRSVFNRWGDFVGTRFVRVCR